MVIENCFQQDFTKVVDEKNVCKLTNYLRASRVTSRLQDRGAVRALVGLLKGSYNNEVVGSN